MSRTLKLGEGALKVSCGLLRASSDHEVVAAGDDVQHSVDYGQLITEYWIEPQVGQARCDPADGNAYMDGKSFWEIGEAVSWCGVAYKVIGVRGAVASARGNG